MLAAPGDRAPLRLDDPVYDDRGQVVSGWLVTTTGLERRYPIIDGVPRFVPQEGQATGATVHSFGEQWNFFNFDAYYANWRDHVIGHTFGGLNHLKGKVVVDAGSGSGMMARWLAESGAERVIALELSHTVDGILRDNLRGLENVDIIQCTIDDIPLKDGAIGDLTLCVKVIQHTPSVIKTAKELWRITSQTGELAFNCYTRTDDTLAQRLRYRFYRAVRGGVARLPFVLRLGYAHLMAALRMLPGVGIFVEKADMMRRGTVEAGPYHWRRLYRAGVLNTFDYFGAHAYQHHLSYPELQRLAAELQPDAGKHLNTQAFFTRPQPVGILLRLKK